MGICWRDIAAWSKAEVLREKYRSLVYEGKVVGKILRLGIWKRNRKLDTVARSMEEKLAV